MHSYVYIEGHVLGRVVSYIMLVEIKSNKRSTNYFRELSYQDKC